MATENKKCSFTAVCCAYALTGTGIEPCNEIFDLLLQKCERNEIAMAAKTFDVGREMAPHFEARLRLTDKLLQALGLRQTVELASGFSPHFYLRTRRPKNIHIEIDLPGNMQIKQQIVSELVMNKVMEPRQNWDFITGNVLDAGMISQVRPNLRNEPVGFIMTGLLRYLNPHDREKLFRDLIVPIAQEHGGYLLTPDIELLSEANATPESRARYDAMAEKIGFDVRPNLFADEDAARKFFTKFGGTIEEYALIDLLPELQSPMRFGLKPEKVEALLHRTCRFYVVKF